VKPPFHLRKAIDHRSAQLEEEEVSVILLSNMRLQQQVLGYCISRLQRNNVMFGCQESHVDISISVQQSNIQYYCDLIVALA
jgi:hypothetical protein